MASKTKTEQNRFAKYYGIYIKHTPKISEALKMQKTASTNSAKAAKTMETRRTVHGQKTMTDSGAQSVKRAGKQRTQSQPETK